jgi:glutamate-1-semialdehyde 2,1-aminomutase
MLETIFNREKSQLLYEKLCKLIPGGVNSPVRAFKDVQTTPLIVEKGAGDTIWDIDGYAYIDYCGSWGALILGHAHPKVTSAACAQVQAGSSFGITTPVEFKIAEKICKYLPSMEKIRFVSSGTEATMTALRLARGYTGKSHILKFNGNYHGHSDGLLVQAGSGVMNLTPESSSKGIPQELVKHTLSLPYNEIDLVRKTIRSRDDLAAVILEPIAANMGLVPAEQSFLEMLREETDKKKIVLIFDEVITGFRVGLGSAQGFYGIIPDMTCLGKIIGGGFPAAAFGGKKEIMDCLAPLGGVYQAGTLSGNPVAMSAGLATLQELENPHFYEELQKKTDFLLQPIRECIERENLNMCLQQQGSFFTLFFGVKEVKRKEDLKSLDEEKFRQFFHFLLQNGVYFSPSQYEACFVSSAHTYKHLLRTQTLIVHFLCSI